MLRVMCRTAILRECVDARGKLRIAAENGKSVFSSFLRKKRTYLYAKTGAIMKQTERPIAVFDSGVGGISVLRELVHLMPDENYIFLEILKMHLMVEKA